MTKGGDVSRYHFRQAFNLLYSYQRTFRDKNDDAANLFNLSRGVSSISFKFLLHTILVSRKCGGDCFSPCDDGLKIVSGIENMQSLIFLFSKTRNYNSLIKMKHLGNPGYNMLTLYNDLVTLQFAKTKTVLDIYDHRQNILEKL